MSELIDRALAREQFECLGRDLAIALAEAVEADFVRWSQALVSAVAAGNEAETRRARHALRGLCGNFGAVALDLLAAAPLDRPEAREALLACARASIAAILETAREQD